MSWFLWSWLRKPTQWKPRKGDEASWPSLCWQPQFWYMSKIATYSKMGASKAATQLHKSSQKYVALLFQMPKQWQKQPRLTSPKKKWKKSSLFNWRPQVRLVATTIGVLCTLHRSQVKKKRESCMYRWSISRVFRTLIFCNEESKSFQRKPRPHEV